MGSRVAMAGKSTQRAQKCGYLSMMWGYFSISTTDMAIAMHMVGYLLYSKFR